MLELAEAAYERRANQSVEELAWLLEILAPRKLRRVLEIGCQDGGTFWAWSQVAADDAQLLGVDFAPVGSLRDNGPSGRSKQRVALIEADSQDPETGTLAGEWFGWNPIDFLFIDADHSYLNVTTDWDNFAPLVDQENGIIAFHDITSGESNGVEQFWAELKATYRTAEIVNPGHRGMVNMGIGVVYL